jgi:hypothetical protein
MTTALANALAFAGFGYGVIPVTWPIVHRGRYICCCGSDLRGWIGPYRRPRRSRCGDRRHGLVITSKSHARVRDCLAFLPLRDRDLAERGSRDQREEQSHFGPPVWHIDGATPPRHQICSFFQTVLGLLQSKMRTYCRNLTMP